MVSEHKGYKDLTIWQRGIDLVRAVYALVATIPETEKFALSSQIKRSAISYPSNIAEGFGRKSTGDYIRFLSIALDSAYELDTQLIISKKLRLAPKDQILQALGLNEEICKMTNALITKLKRSKTNR